eukprot:11811544-Alexandrium_andersonii.AAC.2
MCISALLANETPSGPPRPVCGVPTGGGELLPCQGGPARRSTPPSSSMPALAARGQCLHACGRPSASAAPAIIGALPWCARGGCRIPPVSCCSRPTERPVGPPAGL